VNVSIAATHILVNSSNEDLPGTLQGTRILPNTKRVSASISRMLGGLPSNLNTLAILENEIDAFSVTLFISRSMHRLEVSEFISTCSQRTT
jgi:hypothetical protein